MLTTTPNPNHTLTFDNIDEILGRCHYCKRTMPFAWFIFHIVWCRFWHRNKKPEPEVVTTPAPEPEKPAPSPKKKYEKCIYKEKRMFTREEAANERDQIKDPRIRIYCCEYCNMWHLTHHKLKM